MAWAADVNPLLMVRLPGLAEVLGALGLVLPVLTRIQPRLTVLAALGLAVVMVLAAIFHITRGEIVPDVIVNLVLLALCQFVAYGRTNLAPIEPRRRSLARLFGGHSRPAPRLPRSNPAQFRYLGGPTEWAYA